MAAMTSTSFRSIVEPILNEEFDGVYEQRVNEWKGPFREQIGIPRNYHEEPVLYGFGAAPELPDGSPVTYQEGGVLFMKRYQYRVWGLAFALTQVLVEDGDHIRIGQIYAKHLGQSLVETKETLCANILNRAFNPAYTGGDGVSLSSTARVAAARSARMRASGMPASAIWWRLKATEWPCRKTSRICRAIFGSQRSRRTSLIFE